MASEYYIRWFIRPHTSELCPLTHRLRRLLGHTFTSTSTRAASAKDPSLTHRPCGTHCMGGNNIIHHIRIGRAGIDLTAGVSAQPIVHSISLLHSLPARVFVSHTHHH